jgi:uncharacterized membrane protein YfcA
MVFGNVLGAYTSIYVIDNSVYVKALFGIYQIIVGIKYVRPIYIFNKIFAQHRNNKSDVEVVYKEPMEIKIIAFIVIGFLAGILAGMFGIGGGLIITVLLVQIFKIEPKHAVAISLAAMFLPVGIGGASLFFNADYVNI